MNIIHFEDLDIGESFSLINSSVVAVCTKFSEDSYYYEHNDEEIEVKVSKSSLEVCVHREECSSCQGTGIDMFCHNSVAPKDVGNCKACNGKG